MALRLARTTAARWAVASGVGAGLAFVFAVRERPAWASSPEAPSVVAQVQCDKATEPGRVRCGVDVRPTDRQKLIDFYKKVRPFGPGWNEIREAAGISKAEAASTHENIPLALLGWSAGCTVIWTALFTVGNFLYGRSGMAFALLAAFVVVIREGVESVLLVMLLLGLAKRAGAETDRHRGAVGHGVAVAVDANAAG